MIEAASFLAALQAVGYNGPVRAEVGQSLIKRRWAAPAPAHGDLAHNSCELGIGFRLAQMVEGFVGIACCLNLA